MLSGFIIAIALVLGGLAVMGLVFFKLENLKKAKPKFLRKLVSKSHLWYFF